MVPVSDGIVDGRQRVVFMDYICLPLVEDEKRQDDGSDGGVAECGYEKDNEDCYDVVNEYNEGGEARQDEDDEEVLLIRKKSRAGGIS
jgi:hypothetical protein